MSDQNYVKSRDQLFEWADNYIGYITLLDIRSETIRTIDLLERNRNTLESSGMSKKALEDTITTNKNLLETTQSKFEGAGKRWVELEEQIKGAYEGIISLFLSREFEGKPVSYEKDNTVLLEGGFLDILRIVAPNLAKVAERDIELNSLSIPRHGYREEIEGSVEDYSHGKHIAVRTPQNRFPGRKPSEGITATFVRFDNPHHAAEGILRYVKAMEVQTQSVH